MVLQVLLLTAVLSTTVGFGNGLLSAQSSGDCRPNTPGDARPLYLVIGQSNAAGRGTLPTQMAAYPGVSVFNGDRFVPATPDINAYSTVGGGRDLDSYSLGWTFGGAMEQVTGDQTYLVSNARGSTSIKHWLPGQSDPSTGLAYFDEAVAQVRRAIRDASVPIELAGVVWHQGERDKTDNNYTLDLQQMIRSFRDEFSNDKLPFVVGQIADTVPDSETFNDRIYELERTLDDVRVASSSGLSTSDDVHFDTNSLRKFGDRYAVEMLGLKGYNTSGMPNWTHPADSTGNSSTPANTGDRFEAEFGVAYNFISESGDYLALDSSRANKDEIFSGSRNLSLDQVGWFIEPLPDSDKGYYQIKSAGSDTSDELLFVKHDHTNGFRLEATQDKYTIPNTYWEIREKSPGSDTYLVTAVDIDDQSQSRMYVGPNQAGVHPATSAAEWETFTITKATQGGPTAAGPSGNVFEPEAGVAYNFVSESGNYLALDPARANKDEIFSGSSSLPLSQIGWYIEPVPDPDNDYLQIKSAGSDASDELLFVKHDHTNGFRLEATQDKYTIPNTYWEIREKSPRSGTYLVTAVDIDDQSQSRMYVGPNQAGVHPATSAAEWETFTIKKASQSAGRSAVRSSFGSGGLGEEWLQLNKSTSLPTTALTNNVTVDDDCSVVQINGTNNADEILVWTSQFGIPGNINVNLNDETIYKSSNRPDEIRIYAGKGHDTVLVDSDVRYESMTIYGGDGDDKIRGGAQDDVIQGEGGRDTIVGGDGDDTLVGGGGKDQLIGSYGRDAYVDAGSDIVADDVTDGTSSGHGDRYWDRWNRIEWDHSWVASAIADYSDYGEFAEVDGSGSDIDVTVFGRTYDDSLADNIMRRVQVPVARLYAIEEAARAGGEGRINTLLSDGDYPKETAGLLFWKLARQDVDVTLTSSVYTYEQVDILKRRYPTEYDGIRFYGFRAGGVAHYAYTAPGDIFKFKDDLWTILDVPTRRELFERTKEIFYMNSRDFMGVRDAYVDRREISPLDIYLSWTSDGCSAPAGESWAPISMRNFRDQCRQHDFGYQNFGLSEDHLPLGLDVTQDRKESVDSKFRQEMMNSCTPAEDVDWQCSLNAEIFYQGVKSAGRSFYGE